MEYFSLTSKQARLFGDIKPIKLRSKYFGDVKLEERRGKLFGDLKPKEQGVRICRNFKPNEQVGWMPGIFGKLNKPNEQGGKYIWRF